MADEPERITTIRKLIDVLKESADIYQRQDLEEQRTAVVLSLIAVRDYLVAQGVDQLILEPLFRPIDALARLDGNSLDPLFTAGRKGGAPSRNGGSAQPGWNVSGAIGLLDRASRRRQARQCSPR